MSVRQKSSFLFDETFVRAILERKMIRIRTDAPRCRGLSRRLPFHLDQLNSTYDQIEPD